LADRSRGTITPGWHDPRVDALALLHVMTGAFEAELTKTDPDEPTARLQWTAGELAAHLGEVHRWAADSARHAKRWDRRNQPVLEVPAIEWYAESRTILLDALDGLDPEQNCRTFSPTDRTVRFWHRRQLHETVVHLWDLRSATDPAAPPPVEIPAEVYADGVDEIFDLFVPRGEPTPLSEPLTLRATDLDRAWIVLPDWSLGTAADAGAATKAEVSAPVGELMLFAWNRAEPATDAPPGLIKEFRRARVRP